MFNVEKRGPTSNVQRKNRFNLQGEGTTQLWQVLTGMKGMNGIRKTGNACPACPEPVEGSVVEGSFRA